MPGRPQGGSASPIRAGASPRAREHRDRVVGRVERQRLLAGPHQPLDRPDVVGLLEMGGDDAGRRVRSGRPAPRRPDGAAPAGARAPDRGRARRRTSACVKPTWVVRVGRPQQVDVDRPLGRLESPVPLDAADLSPEIERHLLADHGRQLEQLSVVLVEPLQATLDDLPDQRRHGRPIKVADSPPVGRRREESLGLEGAQHLVDVEGIAAAPDLAGRPPAASRRRW